MSSGASGSRGRGGGDRRDVHDALAAARQLSRRRAGAALVFGVARKVLANQRRGERRRSALAERLVAEYDLGGFAPVLAPAADARVARAFAALSEPDREVLALLAWEGLTRDELSVALGASRAVVRLRLHRARRRFEAALERETRSPAPSRIRLAEGGEET